MGIGAGNSTSRRGSRVAGKKDYTNFDFDPTVRDIHIECSKLGLLQTIQMKLILLWVWAERAVLGRAKTALKFKYKI